MAGHTLNGSGMSDVLLEVGLISSGSINGVLSGKHYSRAMNCHRIMLESLEGMQLKKMSVKQRRRFPFSPDYLNNL